jgi:hypothetical protein
MAPLSWHHALFGVDDRHPKLEKFRLTARTDAGIPASAGFFDNRARY